MEGHTCKGKNVARKTKGSNSKKYLKVYVKGDKF